MANNKKKIAILSLSIIGSLLVAYFGGGFLAVSIIEHSLFESRTLSVEELLKVDFYLLQKNRLDFPNLANREEIKFDHKKYKLQGYFYENTDPHGVVITAHGVGSFADGDNAQYQDYFYSKGWDVFSFDMLGCGNSEGPGIKDLYESRFIVGSAIKFINEFEKTKDLPICLVGHSFGGYGVVSASYDFDVNAVASFSGFNNAQEEMYQMAVDNVGFFAELTKPAFDLSVSLIDGKKANFKAINAIKKNENVDYILVHGNNDETVNFKKCSILEAAKKANFNNATLIELDDFGHIGPWRSKASIKYLEEELLPKYDDLFIEYKGKIPDDKLIELRNSIDLERSSELNLDLLNQINDLFLHSLN